MLNSAQKNKKISLKTEQKAERNISSQTPHNLLQSVRTDGEIHNYTGLCQQFMEYVNSTAHTKFRLRGIETTHVGNGIWETWGDSSDVETTIEYVHRWTKTYRRGWIAKLYLLDNYIHQNPTPVTMLTLTTYQDGRYSKRMRGGTAVSREESFELLKLGWKWLSMVLRKELGQFDYLTIMEPHESGYPHMHIPIFRDIPEQVREKVRHLWSEKYGFGSAEHGVDFSIGESRTDIQSLRNYLLKYLSKGFLDNTGSKFGDANLTPGELVFNALVWKYQYRIFGSSRHLSQIMKYNKPPTPIHYNTDYGTPIPTKPLWLTTELITPSGDTNIVWKSPKCSEYIKAGLFIFGSEIEDARNGFIYPRTETKCNNDCNTTWRAQQVTLNNPRYTDILFSNTNGSSGITSRWHRSMRHKMRKRIVNAQKTHNLPNLNHRCGI